MLTEVALATHGARRSCTRAQRAKGISKGSSVRYLQALPIFIGDERGLAQQDAQAPYQEGHRKDGPFVLPADRAPRHPSTVSRYLFPTVGSPCCFKLCNRDPETSGYLKA